MLVEQELNFDDLDLEGGIPVAASLAQDIEKNKDIEKDKKAKEKAIKEQLKGINEKYKDEIESQRLEAAKQEKIIASLEDEKSSNNIVIDAQNTDDRKKVSDFMEEGRLILNKKLKPFILAEQPADIYQSSKPPIHTIICDEVIHVNVRKYYTDLSLAIVGKRDLAHMHIWCYHKGYHAIDKITQDQLNYLYENEFVEDKNILYSFIDKATGTSYFMGANGGKEPTLEVMTKMNAKDIENFKAQGNFVKSEFKEGSKEVTPEIPEDSEEEKEPVEMVEETDDENLEDIELD